MIDFMERSTMKLLKKRGRSITQIAEGLGRDRKTVRSALLQPAEVKYQRPKRKSIVDPFEDKIIQWIEEDIPAVVMLERVRNDPQKPYQGGRSVFCDRVRLMRQEMEAANQKAIWRFETLPGEYLQVDWGEKRHFPFTNFTGIPQAKETRYCFVSRLKYSRWIYVNFCKDMRYETFIWCILGCFKALGGIPWVLLFDNMKTVTKGRDANGNVIWNKKFLQFASEVGFHPELCDYGAANQKGSVENGVKFVKRNFLAGRSFRNDEELGLQAQQWQRDKNNQKSQANANGKTPNELLEEERKSFGALTEGLSSQSYGLLHLLRVSPESVVRFERSCYSVPEKLIGQIVAVKVASNEIQIYHLNQLVAVHPRSFERGKWIRDLSHYEKTLLCKPRARVMAYREKLLELDSPAYLDAPDAPDAPTASYITKLCQRDRNAMSQQILKLYELWQEAGTERFVSAIQLCHKLEVYGAEYVELILRNPTNPISDSANPTKLKADSDLDQHNLELTESKGSKESTALSLLEQPSQSEVDRDLSVYDIYAHRQTDRRIE